MRNRKCFQDGDDISSDASDASDAFEVAESAARIPQLYGQNVISDPAEVINAAFGPLVSLNLSTTLQSSELDRDWGEAIATYIVDMAVGGANLFALQQVPFDLYCSIVASLTQKSLQNGIEFDFQALRYSCLATDQWESCLGILPVKSRTGDSECFNIGIEFLKEEATFRSRYVRCGAKFKLSYQGVVFRLSNIDNSGFGLTESLSKLLNSLFKETCYICLSDKIKIRQDGGPYKKSKLIDLASPRLKIMIELTSQNPALYQLVNELIVEMEKNLGVDRNQQFHILYTMLDEVCDNDLSAKDKLDAIETFKLEFQGCEKRSPETFKDYAILVGKVVVLAVAAVLMFSVGAIIGAAIMGTLGAVTGPCALVAACFGAIVGAAKMAAFVVPASSAIVVSAAVIGNSGFFRPKPSNIERLSQAVVGNASDFLRCQT